MKSINDLLEKLQSEEPSWKKQGGSSVKITGPLSQTDSFGTTERFSIEERNSQLVEPPEFSDKEELPTSLFDVCINGQHFIATLYGTTVKVEEE